MLLRCALSILLGTAIACPAARPQHFVVAQAQNEERVAGLLALPEVFGVHPWVTETQTVRGQSWIRVRFESERCGTDLGALPALEGWLPAHLPSNATTVWFYSRGC